MNKKLLALAIITLFATVAFAAPDAAADSVAQAAPAAKSAGLYTQIIDWYNAHLNYWSIALLMAIESSFIPFPSELVVPPAAYKALQPESGLNIALIVVAASIGALMGAYINYFLAKFLGRPIIYKFADSRLGHFLLLDTQKLEKAENYFREHGAISTFVGRLITVIRQLISIHLLGCHHLELRAGRPRLPRPRPEGYHREVQFRACDCTPRLWRPVHRLHGLERGQEEVGSWKLEVGSRKLEVGSRK